MTQKKPFIHHHVTDIDRTASIASTETAGLLNQILVRQTVIMA